jgi:6-phosphogluconolactonase
MIGVDVEIVADAAAVARTAAEQIVELAARAVAARGRFSVALSGGSTPKALYELLATEEYARRIDWSAVHVFFGDERCVPPTDPQSNQRMARLALLDRVALPPVNVHPMRCADGPAGAAAAYERELRAFLARALGGGGQNLGQAGQRTVRSVQDSEWRPSREAPLDLSADAVGEPVVGEDTAVQTRTFDLVLLGLGTNGHTASLFPGLSAVRETRRWAVAEYVAEVAQWRMTLTPLVINASSDVTFLVTGGEKAAVLRRALESPRDVDVTPAQAIAPQPGGRLHWLVDAAAAADLTQAASP